MRRRVFWTRFSSSALRGENGPLPFYISCDPLPEANLGSHLAITKLWVYVSPQLERKFSLPARNGSLIGHSSSSLGAFPRNIMSHLRLGLCFRRHPI